MELFHKYQGRSLQYALEVLALLSARERVSREEAGPGGRPPRDAKF